MLSLRWQTPAQLHSQQRRAPECRSPATPIVNPRTPHEANTRVDYETDSACDQSFRQKEALAILTELNENAREMIQEESLDEALDSLQRAEDIIRVSLRARHAAA